MSMDRFIDHRKMASIKNVANICSRGIKVTFILQDSQQASGYQNNLYFIRFAASVGVSK